MTRALLYLAGWLALAWAVFVLLAVAIGQHVQTDELLFSAGIGVKINDLKLYRMDMQRQIMVALSPTDHVDINAVWSPDGTQIAFESRLTSNILADVYVMDAEGKQRRPIGSTQYHELYPVWGSDGRTLAYMHTSDQRTFSLLLADMETGETRQLLKGNDTFISPAWSPDGKQIAFVAKTSTDSHENIATLNVDSLDIQQVLRTTSSHLRPVWTSDGGALTFVTTDYHYPQADIYSVSISEGTVQPMVIDAAFPVWSPDGRYLLYTTNRTHILAVYDAASGETTILRRDGDGTFDYVDWSADGQTVVYVSYQRSINTSGIYRLNVAACIAQTVTCTPQPLTHEWGFYATPKWKPRSA
ncbi:MAG: hypothetical protein LCI00_23445 [Chloroflexi bacterium]|nr:hypothetical protein [Chloroflexota bacterium]MCC6896010.1 PD40 domain-containing protein [Anaerolineae bacterium]